MFHEGRPTVRRLDVNTSCFSQFCEWPKKSWNLGDNTIITYIVAIRQFFSKYAIICGLEILEDRRDVTAGPDFLFLALGKGSKNINHNRDVILFFFTDMQLIPFAIQDVFGVTSVFCKIQIT